MEGSGVFLFGAFGTVFLFWECLDDCEESSLWHMAELRKLKRRAGIAEETLRIKKERLQEAEQEYEEEHQTFTIFSKRPGGEVGAALRRTGSTCTRCGHEIRRH